MRNAALWLGLSVTALGVSGALTIVLLVDRIVALVPSISLGQDVDFAHRSLVVHVNLSIIVWFLAFIVGLYHLIPSARSSGTARLGVLASSLGVAMFTARTFGRQPPLLSNYVPVLDDPIFLLGLGLFAAGVALAFVDRRWFFDDDSPSLDAGSAPLLPATSRDALRVSAMTYLCALLTIGSAFVTQRTSLPALYYYERLFWGGGHILQVACVLAMLAVWDLLLRELTGALAFSRRWSFPLYLILLLPTLFGPWITITQPSGILFTRMMQWGIFPVVLVILAGTLFGLLRSRRALRGRLRTIALTTLATSIAMTIAGFLVGAMIAADTTLVPAHYHLSIGAVTVSFMGALFVLMPRLGWPVLMPRVAVWQPLFYGMGQAIFAIGLAVAGFWGQASRKLYGPEQEVDQVSQTIGFAAAGVGGLMALVCGALFVIIVAQGAFTANNAGRSSMSRPNHHEPSGTSEPGAESRL